MLRMTGSNCVAPGASRVLRSQILIPQLHQIALLSSGTSDSCPCSIVGPSAAELRYRLEWALQGAEQPEPFHKHC